MVHRRLLLALALFTSLDAFATRQTMATEQYELSDFRYWRGGGDASCGHWAFVLDRFGRGYRVAVDDFLGNHNGRIVSITDEEITVVELYKDEHGKWVETPTTLKRMKQ